MFRAARSLTILLAAFLLAGFAPPAAAGEREAAVERLFGANPPPEDWFAPRFLEQVPAAEVGRIVDGLQREHGSLRAVRPRGEGLLLVLEGAEVPARVALDGEGRIAGLFFETPVPTGRGLARQAATIAALPGRSALLVLRDGEILADHAAEEPLAVGSAAKLAILEALRLAVAEGRLSWERVLPLREGWRSLPSGILQDWPVGTPVTLATLAGLAVSLSDNTATDGLLDVLGREAVEAVTPRNRPFPSTRQLFQLKQRDAPVPLETWAAAEPEERGRLLAELDRGPPPRLSALRPEPTLEAEWFMTARELCDLLEATAALPALRIEAGPADAEAWAEVAYKGGSEAGVLNLSTRLVADNGTAHCVVATWNDDAATLDEARLLAPYRAILRSLQEE